MTISATTPATTFLSTIPDFAVLGAFKSTPYNFLATPPSFTPRPGTSQSHHSVPAANENMLPALIPAGNASQAHQPLTHAPGKDSGDSNLSGSPFHDVGNGIRRSTRAPVPSTRLEKLNEIGTNIAPAKPPTNTTSNNKEPSWFAPAYQHFQRANLGPVWVNLVEKWAEYERVKYWKSGKGLPAKGRPEEWSQWTTKACHGVRNYQYIPNIDDPTEFGIAVAKWLRSFNPADFTRTGLHGMVSALTLMVWWGTAALTPPRWNDNSRPQWQAVIQDLLSRYDELLGSPASKRPREDGILEETSENKRPRMELGTL
ncbi:hypothetical protein H1R20_g979, partial [Candolleomyces eurysporus]